ncbi:major allergen Asp F2 [Aspergillus mulundensis]|uniref:Antigen 1 n=1 Tax=Aspergillus mulundensis TaxID=1810919 RepID=A0A3D8S4Q9_9EURO|nr:Antigen 1 [Aspergillus mulundensis]RDW81258.1 Antigen 1 [Aspergillus mulundensis]
MQFLALALALCASSPVTALPAKQTPLPLEDPVKSPFPIHHSCNATEQRQLATALQETVTLVSHAKDHILRWGNESAIYRKYFGDRPSLTAIGAYDIIINGNPETILFRCDNPDGNCGLDGWAGHWRGENATDETVICELSYTSRRPLSTMCSQGYTVSQSETNTFWAGDLLHRLYHMPAIGQGLVEHYADGYEGVLELAAGNGTEAVHDSETLQYFALEAYAYDVAVPGVGCVGGEDEEEEGDETTEEPVQDDQDETAEEEIPENCHTHEGGELHCI